jgi:SAM-dependent methyltransferase
MSRTVREIHAANRIAWDEAAYEYELRIPAAIEFIRSGQMNLLQHERDALGSLEGCRRAIHLQCASGRDTLSLWNLGASEVVGVDISERHIANARRLSDAVGAPALWYNSDVLDVDASLDGTADLVYTGKGALVWLFDLKRWGEVVARLLRPGGRFYVFDGHPVEWLFDDTASEWTVSKHSYFSGVEETKGWPSSYLTKFERPEELQNSKFARVWTIADIVMALISAGLELKMLGEHPTRYWESFPKIPEAAQEQIPRTFSLLAVRPK